jgi:hypothetical protein
MTRRPGLSLVEVLVALFIMGLGTIAILTLFPLGALQMGQALKDDRTAQAAGQADSYMRWYWRHYVIEDTPYSPNPAIKNPPGVVEPFMRAMEDPNDSNVDPVNINRFSPYYTPPFVGPPPTPPFPMGMSPWFPVSYVYSPQPAFQKPWTTSGLYPLRALYPSQFSSGWQESGPSYPVGIDPMGWVARSGGGDQFWVGWPGGNVARRSLSALPAAPPAAPGGTSMPPAPYIGMPASHSQRACSLLDGLTYAPDGTPDLINGVAQRELRYNWLWILQKLHQNDPYTATMTVVVFDKRSHLYVPTGSEGAYTPALQDGNGNSLVPGNSAGKPPYAQIGSTLVRFTRGNSPPVIKGGWIADITNTTWTYMEPQPPDAMGNPVQPIPRTISAVRNCNFYRVVSITDNVADGTVDMELQVPLKPDSMTIWDPLTPPYGPNKIDDADKAASNPTLPNQPQYRTFLYLAGVSEVFERINLTNNLGP